jgi:cytochrome bd-type quinol oxidase subunit 2
MRPRPRQVWGAGVVVAALGLLALVALASEEAPFDVKDDTGTVHSPSWVSIVLLAVIVMMIAFTLLLALSARTVADGTLRVRRRRSMIQMLVLAALAFLALLLIHTSGTAKPKPAPPEATPDTQVESAPEGAERDPGPPWAAIALGGAVLVVLAAAAMTSRWSAPTTHVTLCSRRSHRRSTRLRTPPTTGLRSSLPTPHCSRASPAPERRVASTKRPRSTYDGC